MSYQSCFLSHFSNLNCSLGSGQCTEAVDMTLYPKKELWLNYFFKNTPFFKFHFSRIALRAFIFTHCHDWNIRTFHRHKFSQGKMWCNSTEPGSVLLMHIQLFFYLFIVGWERPLAWSNRELKSLSAGLNDYVNCKRQRIWYCAYKFYQTSCLSKFIFALFNHWLLLEENCTFCC